MMQFICHDQIHYSNQITFIKLTRSNNRRPNWPYPRMYPSPSTNGPHSYLWWLYITLSFFPNPTTQFLRNECNTTSEEAITQREWDDHYDFPLLYALNFSPNDESSGNYFFVSFQLISLFSWMDGKGWAEFFPKCLHSLKMKKSCGSFWMVINLALPVYSLHHGMVVAWFPLLVQIYGKGKRYQTFLT